MDELDQKDDTGDDDEEKRPSVKEMVARIQQQNSRDNSNNNGENSESSDDEDQPLRLVQLHGPMGSSNLVSPLQESNPNYENVPSSAPRSRAGVYSPTIHAGMHYLLISF